MKEETKIMLKGVVDDVLGKYINNLDEKTLKEILGRKVEIAYQKGLESAELGFDMNFMPDYHTMTFVKNFSMQQVTKLSEELKENLRTQLGLGLMNRETIPQISSRLKDVFNTTIERARLISVTETNRAFNMGHYQGAKESGLDLVKEWSAQPERDAQNPCPICEEMDGVQVKMDAKFKFSDGESIFLAPKHPRCKCRVLYVQRRQK